MKKSTGKFSIILIAVFSFVLVFGALLTALAEAGFTAPLPEIATPTTIMLNPEQLEPTAVVLPTDPVPASPQPNLPEDTSQPTQEKTQPISASKTPTATLSSAATATNNTTCSVPAGWISYKIRSGDTLFSIALLFQTTVPELQNANCMGTSTRIITGKLLWVPPNATLTPTKTVKPTEKVTRTPKPTTNPCNLLTLTHLGSGSDPTASPANSSGCPTGKYKAGESISLSGAVPDAGWQISSWLGTSNDSSTTATNSLTMPASSKTVKVIYTATCYSLTLSSSANGADPVASPANSTGCSAGQYTVGTSISLTANPDTGYTVSAWSGTNNDASTSTANTLTMPASAASVSVSYALIPPPTCYLLTLTHTGSGADPTAAPTNSPGCGADQYFSGASITLTASGGTVESWTGTDNDSSSSSSNSLTMPGAPTTVTVIYNP